MKARRKSSIEGTHKKQKTIRSGVYPSLRKAAVARTRADAQGKITGRGSIQPDIKAHQRAEEALRESEALYRQLLRGVPVAIYTTDQQGFLTLWNEAAEELWGRIPKAGQDRWCGSWKLYTADGTFLPHEQCPMAFAITKRRIVKDVEAIGEKPDGTRFSFLANASPLYDASGAFKGAMNVMMDVTARKRAEAALRASEERFRQLSENAVAAILISNVEGKILYANKTCAHMLEFDTVDELLAVTMASRYKDPEAREHFIHTLRSQGSLVNYEIDMLTQTGRTITTLNSVRLDEGTLFGTSIDITERKQADEALRASANKILAIFGAIGDGITVADMHGRILDSNYAAFRLHGFEHKEEFLDTDIAQLVAETDRKGMLRDGHMIMQSGGTGIFEYTLCRKDGSLFDGELRLTRLDNAQKGLPGIIAVTRDISERKQAEEKLQRQNQRLAALREIDTAILAADSMENILLAALSHIQVLIQCRRASIAFFDWGTNEAQIFDVSTEGETSIPQGMRVPLALFQDLIQTLSKHEPLLISDLSVLADPPPQIQSLIKDGLRSMFLLPLFSQNSLIGSFSLFSEITGFFDDENMSICREVANQMAIAITQSNLFEALRHLNAELEARVIERTAQLQVANKELEAFSYSVSHDLRAPLRAVDGFSQVLTRKYAENLGPDGAHYLARIQEATRHMGQLIDDLLSLARITRRDMQQNHVNLSKIAREIVDELAAQEPERRVDFEIEAQAETRGDAGLLKIVLQNLLGNAFKFTSTRAQAKIQFGMLPAPPGRAAGDEGDQGTVFFVRDNGVGFDMAYANKLFGAFQRLHSMNEFPGTGIGLATVQRIVHRHGGRIWVEAAMDKGAAFFFMLRGTP